MSKGYSYLSLLLDGPFQSWGFSSQFERRTTALSPSKSGIAGLLCAALGLEKGSEAAAQAIRTISASTMLAITIPKPYLMRRLEDYHTVLGTRQSSNSLNPNAVESRREYLLDARFGIVLQLPQEFANDAVAALEDPVWGIWFGRKSCIPAEPVCRGTFESETEAIRQLIGNLPLSNFTTARDVQDFESATDALRDQPVSFGDTCSSGSHLREYAIRRVCVTPAEPNTSYEGPASTPKNS